MSDLSRTRMGSNVSGTSTTSTQDSSDIQEHLGGSEFDPSQQKGIPTSGLHKVTTKIRGFLSSHKSATDPVTNSEILSFIRQDLNKDNKLQIAGRSFSVPIPKSSATFWRYGKRLVTTAVISLVSNGIWILLGGMVTPFTFLTTAFMLVLLVIGLSFIAASYYYRKQEQSWKGLVQEQGKSMISGEAGKLAYDQQINALWDKAEDGVRQKRAENIQKRDAEMAAEQAAGFMGIVRSHIGRLKNKVMSSKDLLQGTLTKSKAPDTGLRADLVHMLTPINQQEKKRQARDAKWVEQPDALYLEEEVTLDQEGVPEGFVPFSEEQSVPEDILRTQQQAAIEKAQAPTKKSQAEDEQRRNKPDYNDSD